jgi:hypothetical protein
MKTSEHILASACQNSAGVRRWLCSPLSKADYAFVSRNIFWCLSVYRLYQ